MLKLAQKKSDAPHDPSCKFCDGPINYLNYTIRVGGSDPLHAYRCADCSNLQYYVTTPTNTKEITSE